MIVIDASVAISWVLGETLSAETTEAQEYVSSNGAYVPGNFHSEVVHALLRAERRGRIAEADVASSLSDILELGLTVELPDPHVVAAVARQHRLTAYDAAYLALALQSNLMLCSLDTTLRKAAKSVKLLWTPQKARRRR
ncbi:MAG: type II toxin-antitoxin system VapC family toxin [Candidatus Baltobacteraceae bacterium]